MQTPSTGAARAPAKHTHSFLFVVALAGQWACSGAAVGCVLPFLAVYVAQRGLGLTGIGVVSATGAVAAALAQPLIGRALDRTGRRRALLCAAALTGAGGYLLLGHAGAAPLVVACAALGSAGFYGMRVVMSATTLNAVERGGQGAAAFARYRLCASSGYTIASASGGLLLARVHFSGLFSLGALLFIAASVCGLAITVPPTPPDHPRAAPEEPLSTASSGRRVLLTLVLMALLFGSITSSADTYVALLMRAVHGSFTQVGLASTIPSLVEVPLMLIAGGLADRLPQAPLLALGMAVLPLRFTLYALVQAPLGLLGIQTLDGLTFTVYAIIGIAVLAGDTSREERAWALGLYSSAASIGPIAGPLLAGLLAARLGLHGMFAVFALASVAVPLTVTVGLWPLFGGHRQV